MILLTDTTLLSLDGISKQYPGVLALDQASVSFRKGEVHAVVGENGAGKSTLIKIIAGAIEPDGGTIQINGRSFSRMTPELSKQLGIEVIYQEFNLVPALSAAENLFLGDMIGNGFVINRTKMNEKAKEIFAMLNIQIDPETPVKELTVAYQQIVEIAKAVSKNVKVLIMDEPSAPLTNIEVEAMFRIMRKLKQQGVTIVYISHRMEEIFEICDRVTVMRDGKYIETQNVADTDRRKLVNLMVGRELSETYPQRNGKPGEKSSESRVWWGPAELSL